MAEFLVHFLSCTFYALQKRNQNIFVIFFDCPKKITKRNALLSLFTQKKKAKKQVSLKLPFFNFLVSQQESNKEMRPLKRRGRLAARKVPNFIRHTVSELIGLSIKGKT